MTKTILLLTLLSALGLNLLAQPDARAYKDQGVFINGDEHPYLAACQGNASQRISCTQELFWKALMVHLKSPPIPGTLNRKAYVILQFDISAEGRMGNARIVRDKLGQPFADAALDALHSVINQGEAMRWVPFKVFHKPYKSTYTLPLRGYHFTGAPKVQSGDLTKDTARFAPPVISFRSRPAPGRKTAPPSVCPQLYRGENTGGYDSTALWLGDYIAAHLRCPALGDEFEPQYPAVVVRFLIGADGHIQSGVDIIKDIGSGYGRAVEQLIWKMRRDTTLKWSAGMRNGQAVAVEAFLHVPIATFVQAGKNNPGWSFPPPPPPRTQCSEVFCTVPNMPRFPGCEDLSDKAEREACARKKLQAFLKAHIQYPEEALRLGIEGTANVQFIVEKDGSISSEAIVNNLGGGLGEEALRVIKLMRSQNIRWIPSGSSGRRSVRVQFTVPVEFRLADYKTD